ncbi:hypothetical protein ACFVYJ_08555 [Pontibacter sp. JAM-7]|uniref:hypothetical protein n=1 Tax=Pontibacter sp. JAM-7 TaxID=3366581 RepID=UPI003AF9D1EE
MPHWCCLNLGDAWLADEAMQQLQAGYAVFCRDRATEGVALWQRHESDGQLHCQLKVYFPPEAEAFARVAGAQPCARPDVTGLAALDLKSDDAMS